MLKKFIPFATTALLFFMTGYAYAGSQTDGGLNVSCRTKTITCDNGSTIGCYADPDASTDRTLCTAQWGAGPFDGRVKCSVRDENGLITSEVSRQCTTTPDTLRGTNSVGGFNVECKSDKVSCSNGQTLQCWAAPDTDTDSTLCTAQWGPGDHDGWVRCSSYDKDGFLTSEATDRCDDY